MKLKKLLVIGGFMCAITGMAFAESPLWLRNTSISPDGKTIAFTYKGHIYTVPSAGGKAVRLTAGDNFNTNPVWSPDGKRLAFASDREGSDDIYVMDATGGTPVRLTTFSGTESPRAFLNDTTVIFDAFIMPAQGAAMSPFQNQTYTVDINGGRPTLLFSLPTLAMDVNNNGDILYRNRKGVEDPLRKHERSSGPSDIWLRTNDGAFRQLTDFNGMDADPSWGSGTQYFFTSEEGNNVLNVFQGDINSSEKKQLTSFPMHPVRSLTSSDDGKLLAFSQDGKIYTLVPGQEPKEISVQIVGDEYDSDNVKKYVTSGASNFTVSPSGEEVAVVLRGELYVTSTKYNTTKRITDTFGQERCVDFAPDGRSLVYDSERDGKWQIFLTKIKDEKEKNFTYSTDLEEELLYSCPTTAQQPSFSPDGKKVAFLENRTGIKVIDLDTKKVVTALPEEFNYSYTDGDVEFEWSPDSEWLLASYIGIGGWNNIDVALVKADGSEVINLTESGYGNGGAKWVLDGKGITYTSGRYGYKNQASWGEERDVILMMLDPEAWDNFNMTEEEQALADKAKGDDADEEKGDKAKDKKDKKDKKKSGKEDVKAKKEKLAFDLDNRKYRTRRLTDVSGQLFDYYLDKKGEKIYYQMQSPEGQFNLIVKDLKKGDTRVFVADLMGGMEADEKGENLFVIGQNGIQKIDLASGKSEPVTFKALYTRTPSAEREYMFDHMLSQVRDKFYDENLHGVDWDKMGEEYRKYLPYINNDRDFATLLSEILGELNASHTGGRSYGPGASLQTSNLGAFFDPNYEGEGLKVTEILPLGPLSPKKAGVEPGDVIISIDGVEINSGSDYFPLLEGKGHNKVRLGIRKKDGKVTYSEVKPIGQGELKDLLYQRWVKQNQAITDSISDGKIAYVHVRNMDSDSYRQVYDELLGKYRNCDAVVVDTRFNGGGWLHNDLMILLSGKEYVKYMPRGRYIGSEPWSQWNKPSVMLVNEGNYSDAHGTPTAYQELGIGEVIGSPIPGTMTAVWWEFQIDPNVLFGIPQVTNMVNGQAMENHQLNPDVLIYNEPGKVLSGEDQQLIGAVKRLMETVKK